MILAPNYSEPDSDSESENDDEASIPLEEMEFDPAAANEEGEEVSVVDLAEVTSFKAEDPALKRGPHRNALEAYFAYVSKTRLLSPSEEKYLARLYASGNRRARKQFYEANLRLPIWAARKQVARCNHLFLMDLIQEGNIGLSIAMDKFDVERGYRFSTYGTWWIRQAISRAIADKERTVRLPVHAEDTYWKIQEVKRELVQLEKDPNDEKAILERFPKIRWPMIRSLLANRPMTKGKSLDQPVRGDGEDDSSVYGELFADESSLSVVDRTAVNDVEALQKLLDLREFLIIRKQYFGDDTLEETGDELSISRERVRQLKNRALRKMRKHGEVINKCDEDKMETVRPVQVNDVNFSQSVSVLIRLRSGLRKIDELLKAKKHSLRQMEK
jgi:RNA polymerase primary sigma factor